MPRTRPPFFEQNSEPIEQRIATGLHKLGLAMKQQNWAQASERGLSPTQGQILAALSIEGSLTSSEVAKRLAVSLPTVSVSVSTLVAKGLVHKTPDPRHPRASLLGLSAAGKRAAMSARAWPEFLGSAVGVLAEGEQEAFLSGLMKMIRTLQERGEIPTQQMCVSCTHFRPHAHEGALPHHCAFVDAPMAVRHLRLQCDDHQEAAPEQAEQTFAAFTHAR